MIAVVFTDESAREECEHDFGTREAHQTDELLERGAVIPIR